MFVKHCQQRNIIEDKVQRGSQSTRELGYECEFQKDILVTNADALETARVKEETSVSTIFCHLTAKQLNQMP